MKSKLYVSTIYRLKRVNLWFNDSWEDAEPQRARSRWASFPPAASTWSVSPLECEWTGCFCSRGPGRSRWSRSATASSGCPSASASQRCGPTTPRHRTRPSSTSEDAPNQRGRQVRVSVRACMCGEAFNNDSDSRTINREVPVLKKKINNLKCAHGDLKHRPLTKVSPTKHH